MRRLITTLFFLSVMTVVAYGQTTVSYIMQDEYFPTQFNDGGDFFNQGVTELGMWANTGNKNTVAWRTFRINGDNTGAERSLQVGDVFVITVSATRAFGQIGFSLNSAGTQGVNYNNRISGSRLYFNTDNYGAWYVNRSSGNSSLSYVPLQSTYKNYIFTIRITSNSTADVYLTVDGTDYRAYNLTMNGTGNIDSFSVYGSDLWDGDSNDNAYWKQSVTITNSKRVEHGYFLASGIFTPGLITDGLDAGSTTTVSVNDVVIGGDAGSKVIFDQNNTYTGSTTINNNATLELQGSLASSAVTVQTGGTLKINGDNITVASLTVNAGGTVEIEAGKSLTVSGAFSNSGTFTVKSDAAGTGSLITNGSVTGNVIVQRYVAGDWASATSGWHLISSPVAVQAITNFTTAGVGNGYDIYGYEESTNTWMNYKAAGFEAWNGSANFVVGRGYSLSYEATQTGKAFEGALNNSNVTFNNLSLTGGQGQGWHLVGNPFASAINWSNVNWVKTGFNTYAKVWQESTSSYKDVTDDYSNIIPSANGFWVKASNASNTLTIPTQARTHNALNWLKSSVPMGYVILTAVDVENNMSQECIVRIHDQATDGFDESLDAPFMAGNAPQVYTVVENKILSLNSLPSYVNKTIDLGFVKNIASVFTIQLNMDNIPEGDIITLTDKKLNQTIELTTGIAYQFTSESGDDPNRFLLHFGAVGVDEAIPATTVTAYVSNNILYVLNAKGKVQTDVLDVSGRLIFSQNMLANGLSSTPLSLPAGVYVVRISDGQTIRTNKVIVQ